ncbi:hypothetical protein CPT_Slocum_003 [Serratia phage Slocum]|nr:hypothetical protein CPT_Slocum_003 [Serratia phage Slocum]
MHAIIKNKLDKSSRLVSVYDLTPGVVYRWREYLFSVSDGNGAVVIDTDMNNQITFLTDPQELEHDLDIIQGEPTDIKLSITLS